MNMRICQIQVLINLLMLSSIVSKGEQLAWVDQRNMVSLKLTHTEHKVN